VYGYAVLKAVRVVRFVPEFFALQESMPRVIDACVPIADSPNMDHQQGAASLLDLLL